MDCITLFVLLFLSFLDYFPGLQIETQTCEDKSQNSGSYSLSSAGNYVSIQVRAPHTAHHLYIPRLGLFRNPVLCQNIMRAEDQGGI